MTVEGNGMFRLFFSLGAAAVALVLPVCAMAHEGDGAHIYLDGVAVPLSPLLVFAAVFLFLAGWVAWSLTHPLTRGNPHAALAEQCHSRIRAEGLRLRSQQPTTVPAPEPAPEIWDVTESADA